MSNGAGQSGEQQKSCRLLANDAAVVAEPIVSTCPHGLAAFRQLDGRARRCAEGACPRGYSCFRRYNEAFCCPTIGEREATAVFGDRRQRLEQTTIGANLPEFSFLPLLTRARKQPNEQKLECKRQRAA